MSVPRIELARVVSDAFEQNCYIARLPDRSDCLVVDPGLEPKKIIEHLESENLSPAAILNTHGHIDHIAGNGALKARWPQCPIVIGAAEVPKLGDPEANLSTVLGTPLVSPPADATVADGDRYAAAGLELEVLAVPGHSAGHVVFVVRNHVPLLAFVGDVIFAGGIGRTDFPDGDFDQLDAGIRAKLYTLGDDTMLLPGHGPPTTVGTEKQTNPWVRQ